MLLTFLSICLSFCVYVYFFVHYSPSFLSVRRFVCLSSHLSIFLFTMLLAFLSICLSFCLYVYFYVHYSTSFPVCHTLCVVFTFAYLSVHHVVSFPVYVFVFLSVCLFSFSLFFCLQFCQLSCLSDTLSLYILLVFLPVCYYFLYLSICVSVSLLISISDRPSISLNLV
jgi:hypothetical protein